jgi:hypothetical protein
MDYKVGHSEVSSAKKVGNGGDGWERVVGERQ